MSRENLHRRPCHVEHAPCHLPVIWQTYSSHGTVPGLHWCAEFGLVVQDRQVMVCRGSSGGSKHQQTYRTIEPRCENTKVSKT